MSETVPVGTQAAKAKVGELRPSQLLYAFGVGAIVDLPHLSVMVMGLDDWDESHKRLVTEPRLLDAVRQRLGAQVRELRLPPMPEHVSSLDSAQGEEARIGVPVAPFPRWLFCTRCRKLASLGSGLFRLAPDRYRPDRTRFVHENCRAGGSSEVLPVRFLVSCEGGHLDDFPWVHFVHRGPSDCPGDLELRAINPSGEAVGLLVVCRRCDRKRVMADAFGDEAAEALGSCTGRRPQLRDYEEKACNETPRAILLGASNLWFPVAISALSIPSATDALVGEVEARWSELGPVSSLDVVDYLRRSGQLRGLSRWNDAEILRAIEARRAGAGAEAALPGSLRVPEWEALTRNDPTRISDDFKLREVAPPARYRERLCRVVLAERLREVRALLGFTRIAPPGDLGEPDLARGVPLAPLARRAPEWVPSGEVRGEGVFLELDEAVLRRWLSSEPVLERAGGLLEAHRRDRERHQKTPVDAGFPGMRFVLLHSLAHALLRQLAVECGYTMASIRERIYAHEANDQGPAMAGLLLYTAAPDSEGTLGGLVRLGEPDQLGRLLDGCLHEAEMCSSDPLCAEHDPAAFGHGLHGAACHACMFVAETSCERANRYLDRATLVPVFGREVGSFFGGVE